MTEHQPITWVSESMFPSPKTEWWTVLLRQAHLEIRKTLGGYCIWQEQPKGQDHVMLDHRTISSPDRSVVAFASLPDHRVPQSRRPPFLLCEKRCSRIAASIV